MKKGLLSNSLPKTSGFIFSLIERDLYITGLFYCLYALYKGKNQIKVFGKGFGGEPSSERFPPINAHKLLYRAHDEISSINCRRVLSEVKYIPSDIIALS